MKKKIALIAVTTAMAFGLSGCTGAAFTGNKVETIKTPQGDVVCVIVSSNGNGAGIDCNWDAVNNG